MIGSIVVNETYRKRMGREPIKRFFAMLRRVDAIVSLAIKVQNALPMLAPVMKLLTGGDSDPSLPDVTKNPDPSAE